jgi:hypothetical protein
MGLRRHNRDLERRVAALEQQVGELVTEKKKAALLAALSSPQFREQMISALQSKMPNGGVVHGPPAEVR